MADKEIRIYQGDTPLLLVTIIDTCGEAVDLTDIDEIIFCVKVNKGDLDADAKLLFKLTDLTPRIVVTEPKKGKLSIQLGEEDTDDWAALQYYYELKVQDTGATPPIQYTVLQDYFVIIEGVFKGA